MRRLALIAAVGIALAGCGSSHPSSSGRRTHSHYPLIGSIPVITPVRGFRLRHFAQLISPARLGIVTTGSSSCPSVPDKLVVVTPHTIDIHLTIGSWEGGKLVAHPPPSGICTADYGTTQMALTIPQRIRVHRPLTVRFFYKGSSKPLVRVAAPLQS